jgi:hypothetical protein
MASGKSSTSTKIKVFSRVVKLTYLQSQQVRGGGRDLGNLVGEGGGVGTVTTSKSSPGSIGFLGLFGGSPARSTTSTSEDTGWVISRVWDETYLDKVAYRIGIRDIGIFNYDFAPVSEIVSIRYYSPKPVNKVSLRVVESIPGSYPVGPRYIEYYVSADDGKTWLRINPLDHPTLIGGDGLVVPKIITFNPEIGGDPLPTNKYVETESPVLFMRVRAVIRGAQDVPEPTKHTPELKRYRLLMYPKGGL